MYADVIIELTIARKKLYALEESIVSEERMDSNALRSKQALLVSEIIQSLHDVENVLKRETQFTSKPNQRTLVHT